MGLEPRHLPDRDHARDRRLHPRRAPLRQLRDRVGRDRVRRRLSRDALQRRQARDRRRLVGPLRGDAALRDAAHLRRDRRHVLRALGRRQHRPRGDDADGRVLRRPRRRQDRLVDPRPPLRDPLGWRRGPPLRVLRDPPAHRPDSRRHGDQLPRPRPDRVPLHRHLRPARDLVQQHPGYPRRPPQLHQGRAVPRGRSSPR